MRLDVYSGKRTLSCGVPDGLSVALIVTENDVIPLSKSQLEPDILTTPVTVSRVNLDVSPDMREYSTSALAPRSTVSSAVTVVTGM